MHLLPGSEANVWDVVLWLLIAPELVSGVEDRRILGKLGGLMICRLSREELAERFEHDL